MYNKYHSLKEVYDKLAENPNHTYFRLYHSNIHYVRRHLEDKFEREFSLEETYTLLYEEGLLPAHEYGIPRWFIRKYSFY